MFQRNADQKREVRLACLPVITKNSGRTRELRFDQLMLAKAGVLTDFPNIAGT